MEVMSHARLIFYPCHAVLPYVVHHHVEVSLFRPVHYIAR